MSKKDQVVESWTTIVKFVIEKVDQLQRTHKNITDRNVPLESEALTRGILKDEDSFKAFKRKLLLDVHPDRNNAGIEKDDAQRVIEALQVIQDEFDQYGEEQIREYFKSDMERESEIMAQLQSDPEFRERLLRSMLDGTFRASACGVGEVGGISVMPKPTDASESESVIPVSLAYSEPVPKKQRTTIPIQVSCMNNPDIADTKVEMRPNETIGELSTRISQETGIPKSQIKLHDEANGKWFAEDVVLKNTTIIDTCTAQVFQMHNISSVIEYLTPEARSAVEKLLEKKPNTADKSKPCIPIRMPDGVTDAIQFLIDESTKHGNGGVPSWANGNSPQCINRLFAMARRAQTEETSDWKSWGLHNWGLHKATYCKDFRALTLALACEYSRPFKVEKDVKNTNANTVIIWRSFDAQNSSSARKVEEEANKVGISLQNAIYLTFYE